MTRLFCAAIIATTIIAQAQTFQVLHNFTSGRDGANPLDGLTIDHNGNLYGTASAGGNQVPGCINPLGTSGGWKRGRRPSSLQHPRAPIPAASFRAAK